MTLTTKQQAKRNLKDHGGTGRAEELGREEVGRKARIIRLAAAGRWSALLAAVDHDRLPIYTDWSGIAPSTEVGEIVARSGAAPDEVAGELPEAMADLDWDQPLDYIYNEIEQMVGDFRRRREGGREEPPGGGDS